MIEISENIFWDNDKGFYEQDSEALLIIQNIVDNVEPTTFVDEFNRPISLVWISNKIKINQITEYKYDGNSKMSWTPKSSTFKISLL